MSNLAPEAASPISDDIRLLSVAQTPPAYPAAGTPRLGMDNMAPITPKVASDNYQELSGGKATPWGTLSRTQTRFREELSLSEADPKGVLEQKYCE